MKTKVYFIDGKQGKEIELPALFSTKIREDLISKVIEALKKQQPYAPSPVAGKQASASGILIHRRHVWKSQYGRGISRVPRKILSKKGSQFNWEAAQIPQARGGLRAHPPKVEHFLKQKRINKKELELALKSALAATAEPKYVKEKYSKLKESKINAPFIVEDKIIGLKAKDMNKTIQNVLGEVFEAVIKKKAIRAGRGKMRGRRHKTNAGLLIVVGEKDNIKTKAFDVVKTNNISVEDLAKGGIGRLTIYTEKAIGELNNRFKEK